MSAWHHRATARHGFCSDHGARIHLGDHHRSSEASPAGTKSMRGHEHVAGDHDCGVLAFLGQSLLQIQGQAPELGAAPSPLFTCSGQPLTKPQIALLNCSPKQSPPRG